MRGYKQPAHCACGEPHASDHSSPAHRQSYDASQWLLLSASVGMRLSTKEKAFCQTAPEGSPDFAEELTRESQQWLGKGDVLNLLGICSLIATDRQIHATCPPAAHLDQLPPVSAVASKTRDLACCDGAAAEAHLCHHRLKPARWTLRAAIAPVSYNSAIQVPLLFL